MYDAQKLTYIVRAVHRAIMENLLTSLQVYATILHRPRIATAGSIHGYGIRCHSHRQWQHRIMTVVGRIL